MTANEKSLWVEFLEGPKLGEQWKAQSYRHVKRCPVDDAPKGIVAPAGSSKGAQAGVDKTGITKAMSIFAKAGVGKDND